MLTAIKDLMTTSGKTSNPPTRAAAARYSVLAANAHFGNQTNVPAFMSGTRRNLPSLDSPMSADAWNV